MKAYWCKKAFDLMWESSCLHVIVLIKALDNFLNLEIAKLFKHANPFDITPLRDTATIVYEPKVWAYVWH